MGQGTIVRGRVSGWQSRAYPQDWRRIQRSSLRFWRVKSSSPAQVAAVSFSGMGAMQIRTLPNQRCAKMLWPHNRHFGMRFIILLHTSVERVTAPARSRRAAHAVKDGAPRAKPDRY